MQRTFTPKNVRQADEDRVSTEARPATAAAPSVLSSAIVVLWDENDYSTAPNTNQVMLIVDTNYGAHGVSSNTYYNHYALLKSIEAGMKLPCLNHACDADVAVMTDLFN